MTYIINKRTLLHKYVSMYDWKEDKWWNLGYFTLLCVRGNIKTYCTLHEKFAHSLDHVHSTIFHIQKGLKYFFLIILIFVLKSDFNSSIAFAVLISSDDRAQELEFHSQGFEHHQEWQTFFMMIYYRQGIKSGAASQLLAKCWTLKH